MCIEKMKENPFVHELKITRWQKVQIGVMTFTIVPIRLLLAFFGFVVTWILALIFTIGATENQKAGPFRSGLYHILQICGKILLFIVGFRHWKVVGKRASFKEAPILIVTPHSSLWDIVVFFISPPFPCALSKLENYQIPIFGTLMKAVQPILVHRNSDVSKQVTANTIKERVNSGSWPQLVVFPEGTCTNKKCLIKFKLGAFLAGTPVQPVILRYINSVDIATWTEISPSAFYLIWLTMCQINLQVEVEYLPVYKPSQMEIDNPALYANNVQKHLAKILHMPISDHTYEDRLLMRQAGKLQLPKHIAVLQFFKVSKQLKIQLNDAMERLSEFANICTKKAEGVFDIEDLAQFLQLSVTPLLTRLFEKFDIDKVGKVSYYQYVMGYYSVSHEVTEYCKVNCNLNLLIESFETSNLDKEIQVICKGARFESSTMTREQMIKFLNDNLLYGIMILWQSENIGFFAENKNSYSTNLVNNLHKRR